MIQATLIFILGFLSAVFLAVLVAPAIWRRAVALTHRRIEAALPLSLNEISADKDALRASYAMTVRKLEVTVRALKEQIAAQSIDTDRARDEARRAARERDEKMAAIAALEAQQGALRAELVKAEKETGRLAELIAGRDRTIGERADEIEKLGAMYDEATFVASNRQIELVAQESKLTELAEALHDSREGQEQAEALLHEVRAENDRLEKAVRAEKRRLVTIERKVEELTTTLSDRDEKLERRERDVKRLREKLRAADEGVRDMTARLAAAEDRTARLGDELAAQGRENKALRVVQEKKRGAGNPDNAGEKIETALLRERIDDLAAEMVSLTARLEGPESPIGKVLAGQPASAAGKKGEALPVSLAERIVALQNAGGRRTVRKG